MFNSLRPLIGSPYSPHPSILASSRTAQYFNEIPELEEAYLGAVKAVEQTGCTRIGLGGHAESFDYPLWPLLARSGQPITIIYMTSVAPPPDDTTRQAWQAAQGEVCAIVYLDDLLSLSTPLTPGEIRGQVIFRSPLVIVTQVKPY